MVYAVHDYVTQLCLKYQINSSDSNKLTYSRFDVSIFQLESNILIWKCHYQTRQAIVFMYSFVFPVDGTGLQKSSTNSNYNVCTGKPDTRERRIMQK